MRDVVDRHRDALSGLRDAAERDQANRDNIAIVASQRSDHEGQTEGPCESCTIPNRVTKGKFYQLGTKVLEDGNSFLLFQEDGNLVVYRGANNAATFASGTHNRDAKVLRFQPDGNLVIYNSQGIPIWATNTWTNGQDMELNNGVLKIKNIQGATVFTGGN